MDKIDIDKLIEDRQALEEAEAKLAEARDALQAPLGQILEASGIGWIASSEKLTSCWTTRDGGLTINTEMTEGGYDTFSYTIPAEIMKAEDPLAAAHEYKHKKDSEEEGRRRARTLAEIERLKRTL